MQNMLKFEIGRTRVKEYVIIFQGMHFGRRPYVYSYLKNILGFSFLFLFQRDIR